MDTLNALSTFLDIYENSKSTYKKEEGMYTNKNVSNITVLLTG
jgi:hypothetical protein